MGEAGVRPGPILAGVALGDTVQVGGSPGCGLADRRTAGSGYRLAAQFCRHDGYRQLLAGFLHHPHHQRYADQDLELYFFFYI